MKTNITLFACAILIDIADSAYANPIVPDLYGASGDGALWMMIAPSALLIEYLAVRWFFRKWAKFRYVLPGFILINIVTFPLTQILGLSSCGWRSFCRSGLSRSCTEHIFASSKLKCQD